MMNVEYDMDSEDETWLSSRSHISEKVFEETIDKLEKGAFLNVSICSACTEEIGGKKEKARNAKSYPKTERRYRRERLCRLPNRNFRRFQSNRTL